MDTQVKRRWLNVSQVASRTAAKRLVVVAGIVLAVVGGLLSLRTSDSTLVLPRENRVLLAQGNDTVKFQALGALGAASDGGALVAESGGRILRFLPNGDFAGTWGDAPGEPPFTNVQGIGFDESGSVYVVDGGGSVGVFAGDGKRTRTIDVRRYGPFGLGGIAVARDGRVFLTDVGNNRVLVLNGDGTLLTTIGAPGDGPGQFRQPRGIALDRDGLLYIADMENKRIQVLDGGGQPRSSVSLDVGAVRVAMDAQGRVYTPGGRGGVLAYGRAGELLTSPEIVQLDGKPLFDNFLSDIAVRPDGVLLVTTAGRLTATTLGAQTVSGVHSGLALGGPLVLVGLLVAVAALAGGRARRLVARLAVPQRITQLGKVGMENLERAVQSVDRAGRKAADIAAEGAGAVGREGSSEDLATVTDGDAALDAKAQAVVVGPGSAAAVAVAGPMVGEWSQTRPPQTWWTANARRLAIGAGLALVAAVAIAFLAQTNLPKPQQYGLAVALYGIAAVLAAGSMTVLDRCPAPSKPREQSAALKGNLLFGRWAAWAGVALVALAIVVSVYDVKLMLATARDFQAIKWVWIASVLLCALGFAAGIRGIDWNRRRWIEVAIVVGILGLAWGLRFVNLTGTPAAMHGDESMMGLEARRILGDAQANLFTTGWFAHPNLSFAVIAGFKQLFGDDLFGLRMNSVVLGVLSVLFSYLLARELFGSRVAAIAGVLVAVSQWHIHFSRVGLNNMQSVFATALAYYLFFRALNTRRLPYYGLAGLALGFGLETYMGSRVVPVVLVLFVLYKLVTEHGFARRQAGGMALLVVATLVFFAPAGVDTIRMPGNFIARSQGVWIFTPENWQHETAAFGNDVTKVLWGQAKNTLEAFNLRGETSGQYNQHAPLVDFWSSTLLVLGVAYALVRPRQPALVFCSLALWVPLIIAGVFTIDALFSPRAVVILPVLFVFPALVVDRAWEAASRLGGRTRLKAVGALAMAFVALAGVANYNDYFVTWVTNHPPGDYHLLANYARSVNGQARVYLIAPNTLSLRFEIVLYLARGLEGEDVRSMDQALKLVPPPNKLMAFVIAGRGYETDKLPALQAKYPGGKVSTIKDARGQTAFVTYVVGGQDTTTSLPAEGGQQPMPAASPSSPRPTPVPLG